MISRTPACNRRSLLRWMFQRGDDRIVCQVDAGPSFTVSVIPERDAWRTLIEKFDDRLHAFQRHAQVATELRAYGWTVASYGR